MTNKELLNSLWELIVIFANGFMISDLFANVVDIGEYNKRNKIETFILLIEFIILTAFVLFVQ